MCFRKIKINITFNLKYLLFFLIYYFILTNNTSANNNYYYDDFNDGNSDGWIDTYMSYCGNSKWKVDENGRYGLIVENVWGCKSQSIWMNPVVPVESSFIYEFDMTFSQSPNMDRNYYIKYHDIGKWYGFHIVDQSIYLEKVYWGENYVSPFPVITYPFRSNLTYHFKTSVFNEKIYLEITDNQNQVFKFTYVDTAPILPNKYVGLRGGTGDITSSEVWFDNIELTIIPNPPDTTFNLPIDYVNRTSPTQLQFQSAFWGRLTAAFDHNKQGNKFTPFTTIEYNKKACPNKWIGIECYDSHNGTDFAPSGYGLKESVFPVANGKVEYVSPSKNNKCVPDKSGYGCVVIIYHPEQDLYTLYAHLSEILTSTGSGVTYDHLIAKMGNTGCGPRCGVHIHLGVMKDKTPKTQNLKITASDWENIMLQAEPLADATTDKPPKHWCTYKSPTGIVLSFQDPSGWSDSSKQDPWNLPIDLGGCNTESPYQWMHNVGTVKPSVNINGLWYGNESD